jgi:thioester reductase-like protein
MLFNELIFITGFPGFIAGRLLKRLTSEGARFILLVQPALMQRANEEIARIVDETGAQLSSFRIFEGDVTHPDLGLGPFDLETARNETSSLFHLAAVYDLAVTRELAMRVNVEGTRNVNSLARTIRDLRRYHYVSTCYVAGKRKGLIRETELKHGEGFRNYYEETKHLAELEVEAMKSELPVTIHRPAVVCGDSKTGETAKYDGIYYLIHYLRKSPALLSLFNIGNDDVRLNLVPVDFVIESMVALAKDERSAGATVQLADPSPITSRELFDVIAQTLAGRSSRVTVPAGLVEWSLMLPFSPSITGLPHYAVPYFFLDQTYDATVATELLQPHSIVCPRFADYVKNLVEFVGKHPRL